MLRETAPIAVAFDIDCSFGKERHEPVIQREGLSREPEAFLAAVVERIGLAFPQLRGAVPLVCTSHVPGKKLSYHLKYAGAYLRDMAERDYFTGEIRARLASLIPLVDPSVYSLRRQMRLPFSYKFGDASRPLLPAGHEKFAAGDAPDSVAVLEHMWTVVPTSAAPFYPDGVPADVPADQRRTTSKRKHSGDEIASRGPVRTVRRVTTPTVAIP